MTKYLYKSSYDEFVICDSKEELYSQLDFGCDAEIYELKEIEKPGLQKITNCFEKLNKTGPKDFPRNHYNDKIRFLEIEINDLQRKYLQEEHFLNDEGKKARIVSIAEKVKEIDECKQILIDLKWKLTEIEPDINWNKILGL